MGLQIPLLLHADTVVYAFFALSGFFAWQSYGQAPSAGYFVKHRLLRLLPAYWAVVLVSALGLSVVSDYTWTAYFTSSGFWKYLLANGLLLNFLAPELPGVFTGQLLSAVNGSLWYVKLEVAFTLALPVLAWGMQLFRTLTEDRAVRKGSVTRHWGLVPIGLCVWLVLSMALFAFRFLCMGDGSLLFRYLCNFMMFLSGVVCAQSGWGISWRPAFSKICFFSLIILGIFVEWRAAIPSAYLYFLCSAVVIWAMILLFMATGIGAFFNRNNMTYSLYLCHFPVVQLALSCTSDLTAALLLTVLLLGVATPALYYGIERRKSFFSRS